MVGSTGSAYPPPRSGYDELDTTLMPPRSGGEYDRGSPGPMQAGAMAQHFHGPAGDGGKDSNFFLCLWHPLIAFITHYTLQCLFNDNQLHL